MVDFHGFRIDMRLEGIMRIGQGWKGMWHGSKG
jgi:hypothetical protein